MLFAHDDMESELPSSKTPTTPEEVMPVLVKEKKRVETNEAEDSTPDEVINEKNIPTPSIIAEELNNHPAIKPSAENADGDSIRAPATEPAPSTAAQSNATAAPGEEIPLHKPPAPKVPKTPVQSPAAVKSPKPPTATKLATSTVVPKPLQQAVTTPLPQSASPIPAPQGHVSAKKTSKSKFSVGGLKSKFGRK